MYFISSVRWLRWFAVTVLGFCLLGDGPSLAAQQKRKPEKKPERKQTAPFQGHGSTIAALAITSDNQTLVTGSHDNDIRIWDLASGDERKHLRGHPGGVEAVALSADDTLLASTSVDPFVKIWYMSSGKEKRTIQTGYRIWCLGFTTDGQTIVAGGEGPVKLWDVGTGKELSTLEVVASPRDGRPVLAISLAITADGKFVYVGYGDGTIRLYDLTTGKVRTTLRVGNNSVSQIVLSPDQMTLACIADIMTISIWDVFTGKERVRMPGQQTQAWSLAFSPDSTILASGGWDGLVRFWNPATGQERVAFKAHTTWRVHTLAFTPNGTRLVTGAGAQLKPGEVKLWDVTGLLKPGGNK